MKAKIFQARNFLILFVCALMLIFILQSNIYLQSVKNGLNLYVTAVLPSMLPFFFFSKLLTEINFASDAGKLLTRPLRFFYSSPPIGGYIMIMSFLCGYPVGAKLIGEFYENGLINTQEAKKISSFTSTSGPLFIVGTIGVSMFNNKMYGFLLLLSHYLATIINGLIFRGKKSLPNLALPQKNNADDILNKTMLNTFLSIGLVGGFITIFNLLLDVCVNIGFIPLLEKGMSFLGVPTQITSGVAGGLIEMTKGCLILSRTNFPIRLILPICSFLVTFGGLSVTFQSLTFLSKTKISPAFYFLTKTTQGIISSIICFLLTLAFC